MKKLTILAFVALLPFTSIAQKHVYEDLLVMYVDEKFEKCIAKAEVYINGDDTKRDPLPYLYVSMCYYEMSRNTKYELDYPKASLEALKWAVKYRKKDKEKEFFGNYEDYWASLNTMALETGEGLLDDQKTLSKAKQIWVAATGYYPENPGAWLMLAMCHYKANLAKEGDVAIQEYNKAIAAAGDISTLPPDQKKMLKNGLIRYCDYLVSKGMRDKAKQVASVGKDVFMGEDDFKGLWNSL